MNGLATAPAFFGSISNVGGGKTFEMGDNGSFLPQHLLYNPFSVPFVLPLCQPVPTENAYSCTKNHGRRKVVQFLNELSRALCK